MRADLAQRLLSGVMGWGTGEFQQYVPDLQALAEVKYDEYGNYSPGGKFIESLAGWLSQFPAGRRQVALDFVMERLVFISEAELRHLVSLVPTTIIDPVLRARIAVSTELDGFRIAEIERHPEFAVLRRKSLVLGASDGARLDQLRRVSGLSHEQFLQTAAPSVAQLEKLVSKMRKSSVLEGQDHRFEHVFIVDDFSGSGRTLIRREDGEWDGKIIGLQTDLAKATEAGWVAADVPGTIVLYCASEQALFQVRDALPEAGLGHWTVDAVQRLSSAWKVTETSPAMAQLCVDFFDKTSVDDDKGEAPIGYSDCALPVVLSHNAPNNSICLLWLDTRDQPESKKLKALFPRYERHHPDRR